MALPTLCDCSLLVSETEPRAEVLLVEDDPFICLATLLPELLVEEDSLTEEDRDDELLTDEEDLLEDELLTEEPEFLLLSCDPRETFVEEFRRLLSCELLDTLELLLRLLS